METIEFYSLEQQDEFIVNVFNQKQDGYYLEIGCQRPKLASNTYTLEKTFNWKGWSFDIVDSEAAHSWSSIRSNPFVRLDASSIELFDYLQSNIPTDIVFDYVSIDIDGPGTMAALEHIINAGIKFKAVTFEHEGQRFIDTLKDPSTTKLTELGLVPLFNDVKCLGRPEHDLAFEDWWIHPDYFNPSVLNAKSSNLYHSECIDLLKEVTGNTYVAQHNCCNAYPEERSSFIERTHEHW
jgi:hypothetical protein